MPVLGINEDSRVAAGCYHGLHVADHVRAEGGVGLCARRLKSFRDQPMLEMTGNRGDLLAFMSLRALGSVRDPLPQS
jgi:hypothetical protein